MTMTISEIMSQVESGIDRDDIYEIRLHVQRAQKRIMQDYSWSWMAVTDQFVMGANTDFCSLPLDFKEFQRGGRGPIKIIDSYYGQMDVEIAGDSRNIRAGTLGVTTTTTVSRFRVYLELGPNRQITDSIVGAPGRIRTFIPILSFPVTFEFRYFCYIPIGALDADTNVITTNYTEMLINKTKALAYETVGDERQAQFEALYQYYLKRDRQNDAYSKLAGRTMRMGG